MTAGTMLPTMLAVRSLYSLTKPMMLMPCAPSAGPTGCAGVALPAGICRLTTALTRFAIRSLLSRSQGYKTPAQTRPPGPRAAGLEPSLRFSVDVAALRSALRRLGARGQVPLLYYHTTGKELTPTRKPAPPGGRRWLGKARAL